MADGHEHVGRSPRLRFDVVVNMLTGMAAANGLSKADALKAYARGELSVRDPVRILE